MSIGSIYNNVPVDAGASLSVLMPDPLRIVVTVSDPAGSGRSSSPIGAWSYIQRFQSEGGSTAICRG